MTAFADFLKQRGYTTCGFAKKVGMPPSQISEYRRDIHRPSKRSVQRIAVALKLPADSVFGQFPMRERTQNHPVPAIYCPTCNRKLYKKLPNPPGCEAPQEAGKQLQAA